MNKPAPDYNTVVDAMAATGTKTPSQDLRVLNEQNKANGIKSRYAYKPHTGEKQRAKLAKRAAAQTTGK
jgi:hypothetical protein